VQGGSKADDTDSLTEELRSDEEVQPKAKQAAKKQEKAKTQGKRKVGNTELDPVSAANPKPKGKPAKPGKSSLPAGPLTGANFVFTGIMEGASREEYEDMVKELGGKTTSTVSSRTTYLVYGEILEDGRNYREGKKYLKAKELSKAILSQSEFVDLIRAKQPEKPPSDSEENLPTPPTSDQKLLQWQPHASPAPSNQQLLWTEKHAPRALKDLIGNGQVVDRLLTWVKDWEAVVLKGEKKDIVVRGGRFDSQRNVNARAALISGPPGIGKTTAARLVAKALGYRAIELNASDVRSKSALEPMKAACQNVGLADGGLAKALVIMDEVDGMAGGDRGGVGGIMEIIRQARVPVICICNDRGCQKLRSLVNICYDLRFIRPTKSQISSRLLAISASEGLSIEPNALDRLVESSGNDIRQIFTSLELVSRTSSTLTYRDVKLQEGKSGKDNSVMIGAFDAAAGLLRRGEVRGRKMWENLGLFFVDFDLVPMLVQENYLAAVGEQTSVEDLSTVCDSIALGDVINRQIHQDNEWSLLPLYGLFSSVLPGYFCVQGTSFPHFPEWFGRNSTQKRKDRLLRELRQSMSQFPSASDSLDLLSLGIPLLFRLLLQPLETLGKEAIETVLATMYEYQLTPDMLKEHLIDLQAGENEDSEKAYKALPTTVKSALTRVFNLYNPDAKGRKRHAVETNSDLMDRFDPEIEEKKEERSETETEGEEELVKAGSSARKRKSKGKQGKKPS